MITSSVVSTNDGRFLTPTVLNVVLFGRQKTGFLRVENLNVSKKTYTPNFCDRTCQKHFTNSPQNSFVN